MPMIAFSDVVGNIAEAAREDDANVRYEYVDSLVVKL